MTTFSFSPSMPPNLLYHYCLNSFQSLPKTSLHLFLGSPAFMCGLDSYHDHPVLVCSQVSTQQLVTSLSEQWAKSPVRARLASPASSSATRTLPLGSGPAGRLPVLQRVLLLLDLCTYVFFSVANTFSRCIACPADRVPRM